MRARTTSFVNGSVGRGAVVVRVVVVGAVVVVAVLVVGGAVVSLVAVPAVVEAHPDSTRAAVTSPVVTAMLMRRAFIP
ncbi:hypothetical protein RBA10_22640, partial [Mycobacteroides abscessus subsp. abscessus]